MNNPAKWFWLKVQNYCITWPLWPTTSSEFPWFLATLLPMLSSLPKQFSKHFKKSIRPSRWPTLNFSGRRHGKQCTVWNIMYVLITCLPEFYEKKKSRNCRLFWSIILNGFFTEDKLYWHLIDSYTLNEKSI